MTEKEKPQLLTVASNYEIIDDFCFLHIFLVFQIFCHEHFDLPVLLLGINSVKDQCRIIYNSKKCVQKRNFKENYGTATLLS